MFIKIDEERWSRRRYPEIVCSRADVLAWKMAARWLELVGAQERGPESPERAEGGRARRHRRISRD
jgi:hypothetical protein